MVVRPFQVYPRADCVLTRVDLPKQHSMWAPVGPQLGTVGPRLGPSWARLGPIWECCLGGRGKRPFSIASGTALPCGSIIRIFFTVCHTEGILVCWREGKVCFGKCLQWSSTILILLDGSVDPCESLVRILTSQLTTLVLKAKSLSNLLLIETKARRTRGNLS